VAADEPVPFDPRALLGALERHRVNYAVIGAVARVLHGTDEVTDGLDICPQRRPENVGRLIEALEELQIKRTGDRDRVLSAVEAGEVATLASPAGELRIVPVPEGTRGGWDDLRRHANREAIGSGLRVTVASLDDLIRMSAALARERDLAIRPQLMRLRGLERGVGLER